MFAPGAGGNCIPSPFDLHLCGDKVIYCNVNRNFKVLSVGLFSSMQTEQTLTSKA